MNNIEIVENKIDWLKIIEMSFKRKDWGKVFNLYVVGDVQIKTVMESFHFEKNYATFKLFCEYKAEQYTTPYSNDTKVELYLSNYSVEVIVMLINKKIVSLLKDIIKNRLRKEAEEKYDDLRYNFSDIDENVYRENGYGDDYDEIMEISNDNIRHSALNELEYEVYNIVNEEFNDKVEEFIRNNKQDNENLYKLLEKLEE